MDFLGFIVGPERSGTTLTTAYLSQHPDVYVINDPHYLNFFASALIESGKISQITAHTTCLEVKDYLLKTLKFVQDWFERWNEFKGDPVDFHQFTSSAEYAINKNLLLTDYFHKFHLSLIPHPIRNKKTSYIVKIPDLARFSGLIIRLYPDQKTVFNVRHPVCNVASIIEPNYDRGWTFDQIIAWYRAFFPTDVIKKQRHNVFFTRYEDLLLFNPERSLQALVNYLGIDSTYQFSNTFVYPNQKVMRKTRGKLDVNRLTSSLKLLSLDQVLHTLESTKDIQNSFYPDMPLLKIITSVNAQNDL
jgi:hypothetical protein